MTVAETIIVFVGIPLGFVVLLAALIFLPGGRKRPRYKSGQAWDHAPVWYEPHPEHGPANAHGTPGHDGQTTAIGSSFYGEPTDSAPGSPNSAHGATTSAPRAVDAGPLGGARGTW